MDWDPGSEIRDPGVKKAPDPGSRIRIRNTAFIFLENSYFKIRTFKIRIFKIRNLVLSCPIFPAD
jgi:hypothetical protein